MDNERLAWKNNKRLLFNGEFVKKVVIERIPKIKKKKKRKKNEQVINKIKNETRFFQDKWEKILCLREINFPKINE